MQMLGCILAGLLADRFGSGRVICLGSLSVAITASIFYYSLGHTAHQRSSDCTCYLGYFLAQSVWFPIAWSRCFPPQFAFQEYHFHTMLHTRLQVA